MLEQAVAAFVQEAHDILSELEDRILGLEDNQDQSTIDAIFRGLHTVKGSGSMFGYTRLASFAHHFENAFELVRSGTLPIDKSLIDVSLAARDQMEVFLEIGGDGAEADALMNAPETVSLIERIGILSCSMAPSETAETTTAEQKNSNQGDAAHYQISFSPLPDALRHGMRPDLLMNELKALGTATVTFDASQLPALPDLDPTVAALTWHIDLTTDQGLAAIEDVFIFADDAHLEISEQTDCAVDAHEPVSETKGGDAVSKAPAKPASPPTKQESIRIASTKLDGMMDAIGELVIAQARLEAVADNIANTTLNSVVEEISRLVLGLRDNTLAIRMLPIEQVFGKFRRVVRDLSTELGKDVELITSGGETEVDKVVIDRLGEPLVHMIRNAMDHGIEDCQTRIDAGKPPKGTVQLSACQEGGEILISIDDDGGGLNEDAIRARAIERGLLDPDATPTPRELHGMIFEPGFSTAETISSVSGRGVGMDAVRSTIDSLSGSIEVYSKAGKGTRVILRLPVTMAIIDGLRVRLGDAVFVVPLASVEECVEMDEDEAARDSGCTVLQIREHIVPYMDLGTLFGIPSRAEQKRRVVVVKVDGQRVGLVVDDILGQGQTVIKSLSAYHRNIPGLGGATIQSDGGVALILDVATLVRWAQSRSSDPLKAA
ncbi:MAG: chemotaxis protein CheA [Pelagimonas sp.]|jgi:two-component system chemotaxis sensor kinase CheA|nr:chemotaxis protein CheA [Pelagimonas sp.]